MIKGHGRRIGVLIAATCLSAVVASPSVAATRADQQYTQLISATPTGEVPNGPSGHSVVSGDKRYARAIAFDSDASDLVAGDTNGQKDVFVTLRGGTFGGDGSRWKPGQTLLVSRTENGTPANGPSFSPSIDGAFQDAETKGPSCVAFLSAATNIYAGDTNGRVDAFKAPLVGGTPKPISPKFDADTTAIAASGDCSRIAMITGDKLYVYDGKLTRLIATDGPASDPSFSTGRNQDLVFATPSGAWLLEQDKSKPKLVAAGGSNPAYNDVKRQVVTYEKRAGGHTQVMYRDVGKGEHLVSGLGGAFGNGDSRDPLIGNSGYSIAFETDAGNLGVNSLSRAGDTNGATDVYLYTDVRKLTLLESTKEKAVPLPAGGSFPGMNFYNNYITFDSASPLGAASGPTQVYMRYLGGVSSKTASEEYKLETPVQGDTAAVVPQGTVLIKLAPGSTPKLAKTLGLRGAAAKFVPLKSAADVPLGSTLDTTRGRVGLFTSTGVGKPLNEGNFNGGRFQVAQGTKNPLTTLSMAGTALKGCGTRVPKGGARKPALVTAAKRKRRLFSSVHGRFRTRGRNSSATVRGTQWTMTDTCAGTLTSVKQGTVVVRDFRLKKNHRVRAGHRYFARAPKRKH
jgi:hypothetical protein